MAPRPRSLWYLSFGVCGSELHLPCVPASLAVLKEGGTAASPPVSQGAQPCALLMGAIGTVWTLEGTESKNLSQGPRL